MKNIKTVEVNKQVRKDVKVIYDEILRKTRQVIWLTEQLKMTNDQFFLDFLDNLNELSIKY